MIFWCLYAGDTGEGYPDITLLPAIANFFEVTVDELIGNDEISAKKDIQENYFSVHSKLPPDEEIELAMKYHRKYPHDFHIAVSLMHIIVRKHRDRLDEYRPLLHGIAERVLKECTDSVTRRSAVKHICTVCEEDEIGEWLNRDSKFWHEDRLDVYEERYRSKGDDERYPMYRDAGNFARASRMFGHMLSRRNYRGRPEESLAWQESYRRMLDAVCGRASERDEDIPDGWIPEYAALYNRFAAACFGTCDREAGYTYLERSLALSERWAAIPDKTPLALGNPAMFGEVKTRKADWHILLPDGRLSPNLLGIQCGIHDLAEILTEPYGWEWFDGVREEERYHGILERARAFSDIEDNEE